MKKLIVITISLLFTTIAVFSQSITVTSPSGRDSWEIGSSYNITWTKSGIMNDNIKIRLYNETGSVRILGITDSTANNGMFRNWVIPDSVPAGRYVIRIKTVDNRFWDDSDPFTISESSVPSGRLEVTLPNSSTVILTTRYWISVLWDDYDVLDDNVSIEVFPEGSTTGSIMIADSTPLRSEYHWMSPGDIGVGRYYIRVRTLDGTVYGDSEVFEIVEPTPPASGSLRIISPDSRVIWNVNTSRRVTWSITGEMNDRVKIWIVNDSGATTLHISENTENDGEHIFFLPPTHPAGRHKIRVATVDNMLMTTSERFNIVRPDDESPKDLASIKIFSPEKDSVWKSGKSLKILWTKIGNQYNRVKIELFKERSIAAFAIIASDTQNDGTFKWRIPVGTPSGRYALRIKTLDNKTTGFSEVFRIKTKSVLLMHKK